MEQANDNNSRGAARIKKLSTIYDADTCCPASDSDRLIKGYGPVGRALQYLGCAFDCSLGPWCQLEGQLLDVLALSGQHR